MQDSLLFGGALTTPFVEESLVGRNPTYPVYQASPRTSPGRWSKTKILSGASFRGKQVGGKTAATRLEDALVLAVHVMLFILVS